MRLSSDRAARRRLGFLAVAATVAALVGAAVGADHGRHDAFRPRAAPGREPVSTVAVSRLSLEQQVGEVVILRFTGTRMPGYVGRVLASGRAAGVILFRDNVVSPAQLRSLTAQLQSAAHGDAIVATDQEGGPVRTVQWIGTPQAPSGQGEGAAIETAAQTAGRELRKAGINLDLAPVADVPSVSHAALAPRAFGRDVAQVSAGVARAVRGYTAGGVGSTAKHFPGLGGAMANTDDQRVTIDRDTPSLLGEDLPPFAAAVQAGVPVVMVGHALYPALDRDHIASQSPATYGLLRTRLGFRGVAITDSLEARAVIGSSSVADAALASLRAGADLLLTTGRGSYIHVYRRVLEAARGSGALRQRLAEAAGRVHALAERLRAADPSRVGSPGPGG
jgi:beta-N-acetylhexosaminidase